MVQIERLFVDVVVTVVRGSAPYETSRDCGIPVTPRKAVGRNMVPIYSPPQIMAYLEFKPVYGRESGALSETGGEMKPVYDIM
jgi:hypothetical protein